MYIYQNISQDSISLCNTEKTLTKTFINVSNVQQEYFSSCRLSGFLRLLATLNYQTSDTLAAERHLKQKLQPIHVEYSVNTVFSHILRYCLMNKLLQFETVFKPAGTLTLPKYCTLETHCLLLNKDFCSGKAFSSENQGI